MFKTKQDHSFGVFRALVDYKLLLHNYHKKENEKNQLNIPPFRVQRRCVPGARKISQYFLYDCCEYVKSLLRMIKNCMME